MKVLKFGFTATFVALTMSLASTQPALADSLSDIKNAKKIRIGIDLGLPPYGMMDDKLQPAGVDVEVARKLASDLGVALEIVSSTGASRVPNLQTNKADLIISTLSITPERAKVIDFSVPYMPIQTIVFAPKGIVIKGMEDLAGKRVATSRGTGMDTQLTREAKGANIVRYEDDATLITAAITGQADIIGGTGAHLATVVDKSPGREMERKFVMQNFNAAIGLRKNEPELLGWVNQWVKTNLGNGTIGTIYRKHLKDDLPKDILDGAK
jgi:polar amino acid transport system substrate-binding protein